MELKEFIKSMAAPGPPRALGEYQRLTRQGTEEGPSRPGRVSLRHGRTKESPARRRRRARVRSTERFR